MIPSSALIDSPVQCPACGQPVNPETDWETLLRGSRQVMPCCKRALTPEQGDQLVVTADEAFFERKMAEHREGLRS